MPATIDNQLVVYVNHTDLSGLETIIKIETSTLSEVELSLKLLEICEMLTQDMMVSYLRSGKA
jgi:hypothetical protein